MDTVGEWEEEDGSNGDIAVAATCDLGRPFHHLILFWIIDMYTSPVTRHANDIGV